MVLNRGRPRVGLRRAKRATPGTRPFSSPEYVARIARSSPLMAQHRSGRLIALDMAKRMRGATHEQFNYVLGVLREMVAPDEL